MGDRDPADFPNNPNPPAKAPKAPAGGGAATQEPPADTSAGTGALPPVNTDTASESSAAADPPAKTGDSSSYSVSDGSIYSFSDAGAQQVGAVTLGKDDAEKVLKASGAAFDATRGTYDNVPEATIKLLRDGPQSLGSVLKEKLGVGLAEFHRASLGMQLAKGEISAEDFRQRVQPDLVKLQFEHHPASAWHGLGDAISDFVQLRHEGKNTEAWKDLETEIKGGGKQFLRQTVEDAAKALPGLADIVNHSAGGAVIGGAAAAFLGPEAIPVGMKLGAEVGSFLSLYHQELGSRLAALADSGLGDADIHKQAPLAAVKSAVGAGVFIYGVDAMTVPFKARFLQGLAANPQVAKVTASWAYNYGVNAGIKMPAVGIVHQMTSDLMDNLSALADHRPDLMKSPLQFADNAIDAAAGMGRLGLTAGLPGAAFEAGMGVLDRRAQTKADAKLAAEVDAKLAGVERREPLAPQTLSDERVSPSGEKSAGPLPQKASAELPSGTPQVPVETPPQTSADLSGPLSESVTGHPAFVKAVERAQEDLPEGVKPTDRQGVIDAYKQAAQEAHDYKNKAMVKLGNSEVGRSAPLTPDEKNQISAQIDHLVSRMANLRDLAQFSRDPEASATYADWVAGGAEGERPPLPIDPFNEQLGKDLPSAAEQKLEETLANKQAEPRQVVEAASEAARAQTPKERLAEKTQEATVEARGQQVKSDLEALQQRIGEIASTRDRMQKNGLSTRAIDRQLNNLIDEATKKQKESELIESRPPEELEVSKRAKLQMKPASLEDVMQAGFKEGGKQSQARARELYQIAQDNGLTPTDVKKLIGNKAVGAMGDVAYQNFLNGFEREVEGGEKERTPGFKEQVAKVVERKAAREELASVSREKELEREQYIRQLHNLPAFSKMTTEQLKSYAEILRQYDKGDSALAPKRIAALKGTMLEGVKTEGEVRERVAELTGRPLEDFQNVRVPLKARAIPDPHLRSWFPALQPFVDLAGEMSEKGDRLAETVRGRNEELAAAAIRERRATMGLGARIADWFAPQQREVMDYLEAKEPAAVAAAAEKLTPAEFKWANFLKSWFGTAEGYLIKKEGLESRFSGAYAPHVNRAWPEILRDLREQGIAKSLAEFLPKDSGTREDFVDAQGNVLGFNKFFKQSKYRTGALDPSRNVVEAANRYISDFYRKAALDQIAPTLDTLARAMRAAPEEGMHPNEVKAMTTSLQDFVKAYVNNKKGINNSSGAVGELLAPALRVAQRLAALHYIAGNYALQIIKGTVAIPISEYMALGNDLFKAKALKYTEQGKAILEKYEYFTGKSPWEEIGKPGADAQDFVRAIAYGGFAMAHKTAMEDILLGSMTKEEFAAGKISDARLNEIKQIAGRWMDLHNSDSIAGSSEMGKSFTQYKAWAIPPTLSLAEDSRALARQVAGKGKMNEVQTREALRLAALAGVTTLAGTVVSKEMEDDSYTGQAIHYLRRALGSVWHGLDPSFFISAAGPGYVAKLSQDLSMLVKLERNKEGELKGVNALRKDLTPRLIKDIKKVAEGE